MVKDRFLYQETRRAVVPLIGVENPGKRRGVIGYGQWNKQH